jgi:hypothetical protein
VPAVARCELRDGPYGWGRAESPRLDGAACTAADARPAFDLAAVP